MELGNLHELIPVKKLTKRQKEVLQLLKDGEELVYEKGGGWWLGNNRMSGKLPMTLLTYVSIKEDQYSTETFKRYSINGTGLKALETGWLHTHPKLIRYVK